MITIFFYWDVRADRERQEYVEFIYNDYIPAMARIGINITDGWFNIAGEGPEIMALGECEDYVTARHVFRSKEYKVIESRLLDFVENYSRRRALRNIKTEEPLQ